MPRRASGLKSRLAEQRSAMVDLLAELVAMESPSREPELQGPILRRLGDELEEIGLSVRRVPGETTGGYLLAEPRGRRDGTPNQLLLGHCDTVWPRGTLAHQPLRIADGRLYGPGAYDMKAGLVQMVFALRAIYEDGAEPSVAPIVLVNSDEEIGSVESTSAIRRLARRSDRALVLEPSLGPDGQLKTRRKGVGRFTVRVKGRAAHAGLDPESGTSAILALSTLVQAIFELNDPERGTTVNVGTIGGGTEPNVIAEEATAEIDVRIRDLAEAERVERALRSLEPPLPGAEMVVEGRFGRPPLVSTPRNRQLTALALRLASEGGLDLTAGHAGGASDGNTTSQLTATLDGLGAVGRGAHASDEQVEIASLPERAALLAALLVAPPLAAAEEYPLSAPAPDRLATERRS